MKPILHFDYAAIPILLIILFSVFIRKATKGLANRLFIIMAVMALMSTLLDIGLDFVTAIKPLNAFQINLAYIFCILYFTFTSGIVFLYLFFLFALTRTTYRFRRRSVRVIATLPYAVLMVILFANFYTEKIFFISPEFGYTRGEGVFVLYFVSILYGISGILYLFVCKSFLKTVNWLSLISLYIFSFCAIIMQYYNPMYLVEMFATSISLLMVALIVLRPEEIVDPVLGVPSYEAYKAELYKLIKTKQPAQIIAVRFINAADIRSYLGEELYCRYFTNFIQPIYRYARREKLSFELYCELSGAFYIILDDVHYDVKSSFPEVNEAIERENRGFLNTGVRFSQRVCLIRYPEDLATYEEILYLGSEFCQLVPVEQIFSRASDIIGSRNYLVSSNIDHILRRAIREHLFEIYYQPIYSVKEGRFTAAEALIRLNDSTYGLISPGLFIPIAESRGLILPIGEFVLDAVHRLLSENNLKELGLSYIEVNLSVAQCIQKDLPRKIKNLQNRYRISPENICLEITETIYGNLSKVIDENIRELTEMGYAIALDDYGVGYSNIQRILKLPLEIVKIDKSLVDGIDSSLGVSVLKNTVSMLKDIDKELVVEGVETKEVFEKMVEMDCDYIQGYYFSKPLPAKDFIDFLKKNNR